MPKPKVYVTRKIPEAGLDLLRKSCEVRVYPHADKAIPRKELLKNIKWADAAITLLTEKINSEFFDANPKLKIVANYAIGFDNIDVKEAARRGIPVTNAPGMANVDAVAEHTFAFITALSCRILESDKFMRSGNYKVWNPMLMIGTQLLGKTLGIIGLGRIGFGVAERAARGMGMKVIYYDVIRNKEFENRYNAKYVSKETVLKQSDVVSLHVPLLKTTRHLIGPKELKMMKKTAYLINTSRGPVVDEKALVAALKKKQIAGAGIDVYEFEPKMAQGLSKLTNVVLSPHTASATIEAREEMAIMAAKNVLAALAGKKPPNLLNKDVM